MRNGPSSNYCFHPQRVPDAHVLMIGERSRAFSMCSSLAVVGKICHANKARPRPRWRRLKCWGESGVWERLWRAALAALDRQGKLDWSIAFLDGSFALAKNGGEQVGLTRKGKGAKWILVVDGNGVPLGFHLDGASRAEVRLVEQTLDTIRVGRPLRARSRRG